jgi:hypothetical protein
MSNSGRSNEDKLLFLPLSHLPYLLGLCYFLGFAIIAHRLRNYGILPTDLFEAQYLSAGFMPTLVLFLIYWTVRFTWHPYELPARLRGWLEKFHRSLIGIWSLAVTTISYYLEHYHVPYDTFAVLYVVVVIGFAICALGVVMFYARKRYYNPDYFAGVLRNKSTIRKYLTIFILFFSGIVFCLVMANIRSYFSELYLRIPQSYGGMDITIIKLIMSKDQIPTDLREAPSRDSDEVFITRPMQLAFRSQSGYVLFDGLTNTVWNVPSSVVLGSVSFDLSNLYDALAQHFNQPPDQLQFVVTHLTDKLAVGEMVNDHFLASKVKSHWIIVHSGSDYPACQVLEKYKFPIEWESQCLDNANILIGR